MKSFLKYNFVKTYVSLVTLITIRNIVDNMMNPHGKDKPDKGAKAPDKAAEPAAAENNVVLQGTGHKGQELWYISFKGGVVTMTCKSTGERFAPM